MTLGPWLRLLARNRCAVEPRFWPAALGITATAFVHSALGAVQSLFFGSAIANTVIKQPPIFILGHWRSGTTLLQRLFAEDSRLTFPTAYECFAPRSCLVTQQFARRWLRSLHPQRRPMDEMAAGLDHPHEDEFAVCNLGERSPYAGLAFPNRPADEAALDFEAASPADTERWQRALRRFVQQLTFRSGGKRVVLKSPPHTARIRLLLELFPEAKFVHIVRDPQAVIPSTIWLWKSLSAVHGLQTPQRADWEARVFRDFERMHRAFTEQRSLVPPQNLCEVRYEDLRLDPLGELAAIYERFELGTFDEVRTTLENYWSRERSHRTNRYDRAPDLAARIAEHCAEFMAEYGYESAEFSQTELCSGTSC